MIISLETYSTDKPIQMIKFIPHIKEAMTGDKIWFV